MATDRRDEANARLQLVVMAAGMGARFGGLKQLVEVGPAGELLLDYAVHDAGRAGVTRLVFVVRPEMREAFEAAVAARYAARAEVRIAEQRLDDVPAGFGPVPPRGKPWGTGHAVLAVRMVVDAPFLVVNADDFYGPQGFSRLAGVLSRPPAAWPTAWGLVAYRLGRTLSAHGAVARGVCEVDADGWLVDIVEHTEVQADPAGLAGRDRHGVRRRLAGDEPVSMNLWGFRPNLFPWLEDRFARFLAARGADPQAEFYLPEAIAGMVHDGVARVRVVPTDEAWLGVTYPPDRDEVRRRLAALAAGGAYPVPLWSGGA
jgi:NDP-sugar pyrophosphorylase family protein